MLIDMAIKVLEPAGKFVLKLVSKRNEYNCQPARISYYSTGKRRVKK